MAGISSITLKDDQSKQAKYPKSEQKHEKAQSRLNKEELPSSVSILREKCLNSVKCNLWADNELDHDKKPEYTIDRRNSSNMIHSDYLIRSNSNSTVSILPIILHVISIE